MTMASLFDGLYLISNDGRLFSARTQKYLKPTYDRYGYLYFVISIKGNRQTVKAHRLVAEAFIPNPYNKPTVDHINGKRDDNRRENLQWATLKEQAQNPLTRQKVLANAKKTDYYKMGELKNFGRKKTMVYKSGILLGVYDSLKEAAKAQSVNYAQASECANGHKKSVGGVVFCYR